ncbi:MAG: DeoR/GlpR transcriptional regulator [Alphaproteobacteria bacterium]|nr:DeoR/GlpR transcriptional regulator [Alphaproteobacteria bacterium]
MNSKSNKTTKRHVEILRHIQDRGTADISDLAKTLSVSDETIRRDARVLEKEGQLLKLHGALSLPYLAGELPFEKRLRENAEAKRAIARRACLFVEDGDSLMIDTGTTTSIFAQELRSKRGLTIITNSSDVARTLATVNGNKVFMAGGELKGDNGAAFGHTAVEFFSWFKAKHAFISIGAMDAKRGAFDSELDEANIAYAALKQADHRVIITDSEKFYRPALVQVCDLNEFDRLITNEMPPDGLAQALARAGVTITLAS